MQTYYAIVHRETGAAYGVSFPDLPGCFAAADEEVGLFDAAREALSLYAEGLDAIPRARTIEQLLADPDVAEDIKAGGIVLAVPLLTSERKTRVNVMLDPALVAGIDETARAIGLNRSEFIAEAVRSRLQDDIGVVIADRGRAKRVAAGGPAASALTQKGSTEKTSAKIASSAAKVLKDPKASKDAKSAAASALTQKKK